MNVQDSTHNGQEADSLLEYEGFSFLDEEYRALRSQEAGSNTDLRLSTGSRGGGTGGRGSIGGDVVSALSGSFLNSLKMYGDDTDMLVGGDNDTNDEGPINF